jgi:hypothetical protein
VIYYLAFICQTMRFYELKRRKHSSSSVVAGGGGGGTSNKNGNKENNVLLVTAIMKGNFADAVAAVGVATNKGTTGTAASDSSSDSDSGKNKAKCGTSCIMRGVQFVGNKFY